MNIFVCVKQVPDTETKIQVSGEALSTQGIKWVMNPYDEFAVEEALKLKTLKPQAQVWAISMGPKSRVIESLRTALAMGADEAAVIDAPESSDPHLAARALSELIKKIGSPALVYTGKLAIDDNASTVSQMIAEYLNLPHAVGVSKADYSDSTITVEREVEGGAKEVLSVQLPAVIGANKGLNTPRYASLPGIMKAKKKTIQEHSLDSLGVSASEQKLNYKSFQLPPERPAVKMLTGDAASQAQQLAQMLRQEAKVL